MKTEHIKEKIDKKRILIISTVSRQFYLFEKLNIRLLTELGWSVHCAANFEDQSSELDGLPIIRHQIDFKRSPFSISNIRAFFQLYKVIQQNNINLIHCHSPVGGAVGRLVSLFFPRVRTIYTAHGFHFYKGAPVLNWLVYYPLELLLSKITDALITINKEDFNRGFFFFSKKTFYVPGIGVNLNKFSTKKSVEENTKFRKELKLNRDSILFLSIGELIPRKNLETAIIAFSKLENKNTHFLICGKGELSNPLIQLVINFDLRERVHFLGFRKDIPYIIRNCDVFVFPSFQEGLPVSLMEAMACGLPIICSQIRGNVDLLDNNIGGFLIKPNDILSFTNAMSKLYEDEGLRYKMGANNINRMESFSENAVGSIMRDIYISQEIYLS